MLPSLQHHLAPQPLLQLLLLLPLLPLPLPWPLACWYHCRCHQQQLLLLELASILRSKAQTQQLLHPALQVLQSLVPN
jgi:hypothetical protein